jgi:hypothetical protein
VSASAVPIVDAAGPPLIVIGRRLALRDVRSPRAGDNVREALDRGPNRRSLWAAVASRPDAHNHGSRAMAGRTIFPAVGGYGCFGRSTDPPITVHWRQR